MMEPGTGILSREDVNSFIRLGTELTMLTEVNPNIRVHLLS